MVAAQGPLSFAAAAPHASGSHVRDIAPDSRSLGYSPVARPAPSHASHRHSRREPSASTPVTVHAAPVIHGVRSHAPRAARSTVYSDEENASSRPKPQPSVASAPPQRGRRRQAEEEEFEMEINEEFAQFLRESQRLREESKFCVLFLVFVSVF
jgi:hypothetical protein